MSSEELIQRYHHAYENRHRLGVLGSQDVESMLDEIARLQRWKAEATEVITEWDACYDILAAAGHPTQVGMRKSRHVAGYLKIAIDREAQS